MNHRTIQIGEEIVRTHKVDLRLRETGKIIIIAAGTLKILR